MKDISIIIFCAFRYALGRMTYMPSIVQLFIRDNIDIVDTKDINLMIKEITEAEERDGLGDNNIDAPGWINLREFLKEEIIKREK